MGAALHGDLIPAGLWQSTVLADLDFETYSEAGYVWREGDRKWISAGVKGSPGLKAVGAPAYAEHPTTEVMSLTYNLKDGRGPRLWMPGDPPPLDLFAHIASGKLLEAYNSMFEFLIWHYVCTRMGWPPLDLRQLRCAAAKARAFSLPAPLDLSAKHVGTHLKDKTKGRRVIKRYCCPRNPTAKDDRRRIRPEEEWEKGIELHQYCLDDIRAESAVSAFTPDLSASELEVWLQDQVTNFRGIQVDVKMADSMIKILDIALATYNQQVVELTDGAVSQTSEVKKTREWLATRGVFVEELDEDAVTEALRHVTPDSLEAQVLELRRRSASAGVKKLYALRRQASVDERVRGLFIYYRAHTGRWSSEGLQLQNIQSGGPLMGQCGACKHYFPLAHTSHCLACAVGDPLEGEHEWSAETAESCIQLLASGNYSEATHYYGSQLFSIMGGCIRGLIIAAPGKELLCSDYSAIEAVVIAMLAGEQWRIDVFNTHGKIYEMCAAKITGVPFEEMMEYKARTGQSHPHRKPFGKVPELASGYGGWIGAWNQFGADEFFSQDEIKKNILKWRDDSPAIVELWGGQYRKHPDKWQFEWELYGCEGMAIKAVLEPGTWFTYKWLRYGVFNDILYCLLPSGRCISYHQPQLTTVNSRMDKKLLQYSLSHMIYNTNSKKGRIGWTRVETYGGMLVENATQAVARDIIAHAMPKLEAAGYPVVAHVHDEVISEVDAGFGSIEEFESIMMDLPDWAAGWPIKAAGGWRGHRYRKE